MSASRIVVSGFEPLDMLQSIVMLLRQLKAGEAKVENQYKRVVPWEGNRAALAGDGRSLRIAPVLRMARPGLHLAIGVAHPRQLCGVGHRAALQVPGVRVTDPKAAQCGEVLKGVLKPPQCKLFGKECTPERPVGALMVSSEGSCAAYYNYEHRKAANGLEHGVDWREDRQLQWKIPRPRSAFATRKSKWLMAPAARPAAGWSKGCSLPCSFPASGEPLGDAAHLDVERRTNRDHHR